MQNMPFTRQRKL